MIKTKKQLVKYKKFLKDNKINRKDIWDVKYAFGKWIVPRLKALKMVNNGYPGFLTPKKWDKILDDMIIGFSEEEKEFTTGFCNKEKLQKAYDLLAKYHEHLWD